MFWAIFTVNLTDFKNFGTIEYYFFQNPVFFPELSRVGVNKK